MGKNSNIHKESQRINKIYSERNYDNDPTYSDRNKIYLHRTQSMERAIVIALDKINFLTGLTHTKILDFGCGNGKWFLKWINWGAKAEYLTGVDVRKKAINTARSLIPNCNFKVSSPISLPFSDDSFDIITQHVVFTSIVNDPIREKAAEELLRVLKPGGVILWYDFIFNNYQNKNVRRVNRKELQLLFPKCDLMFVQKITLAPPIARRIIPWSWTIATMLESIKIFNTHLHVVIRKNY